MRDFSTSAERNNLTTSRYMLHLSANLGRVLSRDSVPFLHWQIKLLLGPPLSLKARYKVPGLMTITWKQMKVLPIHRTEGATPSWIPAIIFSRKPSLGFPRNSHTKSINQQKMELRCQLRPSTCGFHAPFSRPSYTLRQAAVPVPSQRHRAWTC